jgi:hypothetical protein|nr:MAG TPA: hypothetical protein [Caudoviricetes sp.]
MKVTYERIIERLKALGYPVAEYEFRDTKKNPAPDPPFLIYFCSEDQKGTDDGNRIRQIQASIELYTARTPDHDLERRIETEVLFDIGFHKTTAPIQSEEMYQAAYDFNVVQKL